MWELLGGWKVVYFHFKFSFVHCTRKTNRPPIQYQQAVEVHMGSHWVCVVGSLWQQCQWQSTLSSRPRVNIRLLPLPVGRPSWQFSNYQTLHISCRLYLNALILKMLYPSKVGMFKLKYIACCSCIMDVKLIRINAWIKPLLVTLFSWLPVCVWMTNPDDKHLPSVSVSGAGSYFWGSGRKPVGSGRARGMRR